MFFVSILKYVRFNDYEYKYGGLFSTNKIND
nr:MAG TPA: hypothetical protein [Bacteriophage sp.]